MPLVKVKPETMVLVCELDDPNVAQRLVTPRVHWSEPSMKVASGPLTELMENGMSFVATIGS